MKRNVLQNILLNEKTIEQCVSIIGKKDGGGGQYVGVCLCLSNLTLQGYTQTIMQVAFGEGN